MTTHALWVQLEAKEDKVEEVREFLESGAALVEQEPDTTAWFALQIGPTSFGIFDAFDNEAGRDAHLGGEVAKALMEKAPELLASDPQIDKPDVLADKLPG